MFYGNLLGYFNAIDAKTGSRLEDATGNRHRRGPDHLLHRRQAVCRRRRRPNRRDPRLPGRYRQADDRRHPGRRHAVRLYGVMCMRRSHRLGRLAASPRVRRLLFGAEQRAGQRTPDPRQGAAAAGLRRSGRSSVQQRERRNARDLCRTRPADRRSSLGRPFEPVWALSYFGKRTVRTTLLAKTCDAYVGLPGIKGFMGPQLVYSKPFLHIGYAIMAPAGMRITRLDDLSGKRVAVQFSTPPQILLASRDDVHSVTFLNPEEAVQALDGTRSMSPSSGAGGRLPERDRLAWRLRGGPRLPARACSIR